MALAAPTPAGAGRGPGLPAGRPAADSLAARIDTLVAPWTDAASPGLAVAVALGGEIIHSKGYGLANLEHGIANTPATLFNAGSLAKQFTALAVAMLAERDSLSLSDDIRAHLPEMPDFGAPITIRHLIDHTSGLRESYDLMAVAGRREEDAVTSAQVLALMARQRELNSQPGERWMYCNAGYTLLAEIVARVTGVPFAEWTREQIFRPAGMEHTRFADSNRLVLPNRADSYSWVGEGLYERDVLNSADVGCGELWTTAQDLARWAAGRRAFEAGAGDLAKLIAEPGVLNDGTRTDYAFGQFVGTHRGLATLFHSGKTAGYRSFLLRVREPDLGVVILGNASWLSPTELAWQIADACLDALGVPAPEPPPVPAATPDSATTVSEGELVVDPATCAGHYQLESGKLLRIEAGADSLLLYNLSSDPFVLRAVQGGRYQLEGSRTQASFASKDRGGARELILHMGQRTMRAAWTELARLTEAELAEPAGSYYSSELGAVYDLVVRRGALVAMNPWVPDTELIPLATGDFQGTNRWFRTVRLERGPDGAIMGLRVSALGVKNLRFERMAPAPDR